MIRFTRSAQIYGTQFPARVFILCFYAKHENPFIFEHCMKKVFITIPWFLPAYRAGGPIRSIANLVEHFNGVEFFIFTGDTDITGSALDGIKTGQWTRWNDHTHIWYATDGKKSHELTRQAARIKPDVLFMVGLYSWHFTLVPLMYCKAETKIISVRGMLHDGALKQKSWKKKIFLKAFKLLEYNHTVGFHATDHDEAAHIRKAMGPIAKIFAAGNYPTFIGYQEPQQKRPGHLRLITIALITPMKNILKVIQALKEVRASVDYHIYGGIRDEDYWDACKAAIKSLPANIRVAYRNALPPQEVPRVLGGQEVCILPSESENFGHAIYESLSAGRPVITSDATPFKKLKEERAGLNVSPDFKEGITEAIEFFANMDAATYHSWSRGALTYAEAWYDHETLKREYEMMFTGAGETKMQPA